MTRCAKCHQDKHESDFTRYASGARNRWCTACERQGNKHARQNSARITNEQRRRLVAMRDDERRR